MAHDGVALAAKDSKVRPLRQTPVIAAAGDSGEWARWLEPWGGKAGWRAEMWGQIVAHEITRPTPPDLTFLVDIHGEADVPGQDPGAGFGREDVGLHLDVLRRAVRSARHPHRGGFACHARARTVGV